MLGRGAFYWLPLERQTGRWGAFYLEPIDSTPGGAKQSPYDAAAVQSLRGRRVRVVARILARKPQPPLHLAVPYDFLGARVCDRIELGVGHLRVEPVDPALGLPSDQVLALQTGRRMTNWMSSFAYWYLRGHTVAVHAEPTSDAYAPTLATVRATYDHLPVVRAGRIVLQPMDPTSDKIGRAMQRAR